MNVVNVLPATLFVLALAASSVALAGPAVPASVQAALEAATTIPEARVDVIGFAPKVQPGCRAEYAEIGRPLEGSGRVAVKLTGQLVGGAPCTGWAWATVRVFAPVLVATRALRQGESLDAATERVEREIPAGRKVLASASGVTTARAIVRGAVIEAAFTRSTGPQAGAPIKVVVALGSVQVEQTGRWAACGKDRACAVLPSGKHVEGTLVDGRLLVTLP